ncbi:MAG: bifunctional riboflavin kinase/FAD synthetase [Clostridia bacterium]|nr:bifunctional riboflavin kinase/FAD synthetase [Clostridia bacterium]
MKIFRNLQEITVANKPLTVVLGNFDGVHLGHQNLIKMAQSISKGMDGTTLIFTFHPHPQMVFNKDIKLINSFDLKIRLIEQLGVDYLLIVPFVEEFYKLSPEEFVEQILYKKLNVSHVVAGFNYTFGYKGMGKTKDLIDIGAKFGIKTTIMDPFYVDGQLVSSSKIREYLESGKIVEASKLLGYFPRILGSVISGNKIGRIMGIPTANLKWDADVLIPKSGVYAVQVEVLGQIKPGVLNIGTRPTVSNNKNVTMEVNILDFNQDIYGEKLEVIFHQKLRDEKKFNNILDLKKQIEMDTLRTIQYFSNIKI